MQWKKDETMPTKDPRNHLSCRGTFHIIMPIHSYNKDLIMYSLVFLITQLSHLS